MIKKTLFIGGGVLLLLALLFGRNAISYVTTMVGQVQEKMDDSFSIKFQLKRAHDQIAKLTPEIRRNESKVANEEVKVERLEKKVKALRSALADDEKDILRLTHDLETGKSQFVYVGRSYSAERVQSDLAGRFEDFKTDKATLGSLEQVLAARKQGLTAAREQLVAMERAQQELRVRAANLEARLQMVEVAQTSTDFKFDSNKLTKARELMDDLEGRIRTAEKLVKVSPKLQGRIPLDSTVNTSGEITEQINKYFDGEEDLVEIAESVE